MLEEAGYWGDRQHGSGRRMLNARGTVIPDPMVGGWERD